MSQCACAIVTMARFKAGRFRTAAPGEIDREVIDECFLKCGCYFESWRPTTVRVAEQALELLCA